jgi:hypothetical protein
MIADSPISVRKVFYVLTILYLGMLAAVAPIYLEILWTLVIGAPLILLGLRDVFQKSQSISVPKMHETLSLSELNKMFTKLATSGSTTRSSLLTWIRLIFVLR